MRKSVLILIACGVVCFGSGIAWSAEEVAGGDESGIFRVVNAVACPGRLQIEVDGHDLLAGGFVFSGATGEVGLLVGRREFRFTHSGVDGEVVHVVDMREETDLTLVVLAREAVDVVGGKAVELVVEEIDDEAAAAGVTFVLADDVDVPVSFALRISPGERMVGMELGAWGRRTLPLRRMDWIRVDFEGRMIDEFGIAEAGLRVVYMVPGGRFQVPAGAGRVEIPRYLCVPVVSGR